MHIEWPQFESTENKVNNSSETEQKVYNSNTDLKNKILESERKDNDNSDVDSILEWLELNKEEITVEELVAILNDPEKIEEIFSTISNIKIFNKRMIKATSFSHNDWVSVFEIRDLYSSIFLKLKWKDFLLKNVVKLGLTTGSFENGVFYDWHDVDKAIYLMSNEDDDYYLSILDNVISNVGKGYCINKIKNQDVLLTLIDNSDPVISEYASIRLENIKK